MAAIAMLNALWFRPDGEADRYFNNYAAAAHARGALDRRILTQCRIDPERRPPSMDTVRGHSLCGAFKVLPQLIAVGRSPRDRGNERRGKGQ